MSINRIPGGVAIEAPGDTLLSAMTEAAATELGRPVRLVNTVWLGVEKSTGQHTYAAHYESKEL